MKKGIFLAGLVFIQIILLADHTANLQQANDLYASENYEKAFSEYSKILNGGHESPSLYYNMGNCRYRLENYTDAIYFYEKANLLAPYDEDILHNLQLARMHTYDKIEPMPQAALVRIFSDFISRFSSKFWAISSLTAFVLMLAAAALYLFSIRKKRKAFGFFAGIILFVIASASFVVSQNVYQKTVKPQTGIIYGEAVSVKSAPDGDATELFIIHEGLKVSIDEQNDNWVEIKLADGRVGWIRKDRIRML